MKAGDIVRVSDLSSFPPDAPQGALLVVRGPRRVPEEEFELVEVRSSQGATYRLPADALRVIDTAEARVARRLMR